MNIKEPPTLIPPASPRIRLRLPHWGLAALALFWSVVVLGVYYRQLWQLILGQGWDTLYLYTGASLRLFGVMLLLLAAALALVLRLSLRRGRHKLDTFFYLAACTLLALAYLGVTFASAWGTIDIALPFLGAALRRHLASISAAALLLVAAVATGWGISWVLKWRYDHWRERLAFNGALGIGALTYLGLLLAAFGYYRPPVLQGIAALAALSGAIAAVVQLRRRGLHLAAPHLPTGAPRLWIACTGVALPAAFAAALAPESQFDALLYHLSFPQYYLQAGHLVDAPAELVSLYPMTTELWFGYGLALGGSGAAILLHYACLLLAAVVTYQLAQRYAPGASPWLAVALLVTIPTVVWEASTAYIDLAVMLFVTLAFYALLRYLDTRRLQWLVAAALNLGFALGSKHLALIAALVLAIILVLASWRRKIAWRQALFALLVLAGLSLVVALPWYVRSYLASGNPVFPLLYSLFGGPPDRWNAMTERGAHEFLQHFGRPRTPVNLLLLPWDMTIHAGYYGGTLGPLFLTLLPMLLLRAWRPALPWLAAFAALFVILWASPLATFQMRHVLTAAPVLAVLGASAFGRAAALARSVGGRRTPALVAGSMGVLMLLNLPPFTFLHEVDRVNWNGWLTSVLHGIPLGVVIGGESNDVYLARQVHSYSVWQYADATLPANARVLTWSDGDNFYSDRDRLWVNSALAGATAWAPVGQEEQALAGLRSLGITHLIVDKRPSNSPDPWDAYALTGPIARAHWYEQLYADQWYALYRLKWENLAPAQ